MLTNPWLEFTFHPDLPGWSVYSRRDSNAFIRNARFNLSFRSGRARFFFDDFGPPQGSETGSAAFPHGPLTTLSFRFAPVSGGLHARLEFALPAEHPLLLWRIHLANQGPGPLYLDHLTLLDLAHPTAEIGFFPGDPREEPAFFSNGWGSWNYTGVYGRRDFHRRTRLGPLTAPMRVNPGTPHPRQRGRFGGDFFGILGERLSRTALLAGFLSQHQHFGSLEADLSGRKPTLRLWANGDGARLDPGAEVVTDWAALHFLNLDHPDPQGPYVEAVSRQHGISPGRFRPDEVPSGWSSWYQFYRQITAGDVLRSLEAAQALRPDLPLQVIQIDDGFETHVGDWFSIKPTFPDGLGPLAVEIRQAGFTPGLWLAPFIVDPRSELAHRHPDWLIRGRFNRPANAGYNFWGAFNAGLDLTHPEALDYTRQVIHTAVHRWGFPYLKLDFLYAAAIPGSRRDPTRTRAQVLHAGLQAIRQAAGEGAFLVGCGCPLGPAIGLVDSMRVGADVAEDLLPTYHGTHFYIHAEPDYPSLRNSLQNVLTRAPFHLRWWFNDPDSLLLRPTTRLTPAEIQALATVILLTGGPLLISDDLPALPASRVDLARRLLPLIGRRPQVPDWFDSPTPARLRLDLENETGPWRLAALFNWADHPAPVELRPQDFDLDPARPYWAREFWTGQVFSLSEASHTFREVPPHGVVLLAIRPARPGAPQYLGSDLHLSQGLEVAAWEHRGDHLSLCLERPGSAQGLVDLALPSPPACAELAGEPVVWQPLTGDVFRFHVAFEKTVTLKLRIEDLK